MPADPSRESGTRARVDGRSSDCRRSERRRTADRWWVESESTDLPDSCEPTKRALSSPVLSCSARSLRLDAFSPVGVPRPKSHPTQSVRPWYRLGTHVLARPPSCSDFYASTAARPTELGLARLCKYMTRVAPPPEPLSPSSFFVSLSLFLLLSTSSLANGQCSNCAEIRGRARERKCEVQGAGAQRRREREQEGQRRGDLTSRGIQFSERDLISWLLQVHYWTSFSFGGQHSHVNPELRFKLFVDCYFLQ